LLYAAHYCYDTLLKQPLCHTSFLLYGLTNNRDLHSFPTRRSSDLKSSSSLSLPPTSLSRSLKVTVCFLSTSSLAYPAFNSLSTASSTLVILRLRAFHTAFLPGISSSPEVAMARAFFSICPHHFLISGMTSRYSEISSLESRSGLPKSRSIAHLARALHVSATGQKRQASSEGAK